MGKSTLACFAVILLSVAPGYAQYTTQQQAHSARQEEIRRQNYAQQEALRLLFGPQGIPSLTRPSDHWNFRWPNYRYSRPNDTRYPTNGYYR